jgi:hypothetical protein
MNRFRYDLLIRRPKNNKFHWVLASKPNTSLGSNVYKLLNALGAKGWEIVGSGDFGGDSRSEFILKQTLS